MYKFILVFLILVIAFITIFTDFFKYISDDQIITLFSSFSGAASAYFFVVLNEKISEEVTRKRNHYHSCVMIERYLFFQLGICQDNWHTISKFKDIIEKDEITVLTLRNYQINDSLSENCKNAEIINSYLSIVNFADYVNNAQSHLISLYDELRNHLFGDTSSSVEKQFLMPIVTQKISPTLSQFMDLMKTYEKALISSLALVRIAIRSQKGFLSRNKIFNWLFPKEISLPKNHIVLQKAEESKLYEGEY